MIHFVGSSIRGFGFGMGVLVWWIEGTGTVYCICFLVYHLYLSSIMLYVGVLSSSYLRFVTSCFGFTVAVHV